MKGALCVYHLLTAVHTQTVAKLQKADKSRLNLSAETLVFLQSGFWHVGLLISTNKLFWNSETRCPQGYSLSQNLQKNFSSCVSEKWPFQLVHQCPNTNCNARLGTAALSLFLPTAAADLHWHLLQHPHTCLTCPHCTPLSESMSAPCPLTNRIKRGEIGKAKQWQANDSKHTVSKKHRHNTHTQIRKQAMWKRANGRIKYTEHAEPREIHRDMPSPYTVLQGKHTFTPI